MQKTIILFLFFLLLLSYKETEKERLVRLVTEWQGKEIIFPQNLIFTRDAADTANFQIPESNYKVLVYVDSVGCTSCKLQLGQWKKLIAAADSLSGKTIPFLFFFHPKNSKEIQPVLRQERFDLPVCIDLKDELNKLNKFPSDMTFQTFLLDKDNKVVVIGNPVHSLAVKDLYLKQIATGKLSAGDQPIKTTAEAEQTEIDLSSFEQSEKKTAIFHIKNTGNNPLVLVDVATTCGCAAPTFDRHPAKPGDILQVKVDYQAKNSGFFSETITVKSNTDKWIKLIIKGWVLPSPCPPKKKGGDRLI